MVSEKVGHNACCDDECESVACVLWDYPACIWKEFYRRAFALILLGHKSLDSVEKTSLIIELGSELWEEIFLLC